MKSPVIIGRFQSPVLTKGHILLLRAAAQENPGVRPIILVAVTPFIPMRKNPLPYATREVLLRQQCAKHGIPNPFILPLANTESDKEWSKLIDQLVRSINPAGGILYGGRDNSLKHYSGVNPIKEVTLVASGSATDCRDECYGYMQTPPEGVEDFAKGAVAAMMAIPTRALIAVDAVVLRIDHSKATQEPTRLLVGRRPGHKYVQFPGGMVDPNETLEATVRRELKEETGLDCEQPEYLGSVVIDDWRVRYEAESITSAVFLVTDQRGSVLREHEWNELVDLRYEGITALADDHMLHPMHRPILELVYARLTRGQDKSSS